jgi:uncharacterized protein involved in outer membrane biogenesis
MFKKILKISGISLLVILILLIVLPFIFKDKILKFVKDEINQNLNAKVEFKDYSLGIFKTFPNLYVELDQLSVVGINEFKGDTLAYLPQFTASLDIMSVFGDQIKIKSIKLEKPIMNLLVLKNGKANWDITKASTDTTKSADTTASHFALALKKVSVSQGNIKYEDQSLGVKFIAQNLDFLLKGNLTAQHTTLNTETQISSATFTYDGVDFVKKGHVKIISEIDADLANFVFTFSKNKLVLNELSLLFDGKIAMPKSDINIDVTYQVEQTDFKTLLSLVPAIYSNDFASVQTSGKVAMSGNVKGIYNDKSMPGFSLKMNVENGSFKYPSLPSSVKDIAIDLDIENKDGKPDNTLINLKKFHANMANNPIDASLFVSTPVSNANLKGIITGKLDLSQVQAFYPMKGVTMKGIADLNVNYQTSMNQVEAQKYDEMKASGYMKLSDFEYKSSDLSYQISIPTMETEVTPQYFDLKTLVMQIGKSDLNLSGKIQNFMAYIFKNQLLTGDFTLNSKMLDVNQFMSSDETSKTTTPTTDTSSLEAPSIPKNIDFTFQAGIKQLLYSNLELDNTVGKVTMKQGVLDLENLSFNTLDGSITMKAKYAYTDVLPNAQMTFNMKDIDIKKTSDAFSMVKKMVPIAENCSGKVSLDLDLQTNLTKHLAPVLNSVDAKGNLSSKSITVENSDLGKKIADFFKNKQYEKLAFDNIAVHFIIEKGNITVDPVKTKLGNIPVEFGGSQNLDQTLNYSLLMNVPKQALGSQASDMFGKWSGMAQKAGVPVKVPDVIPVKGLIGGTITKPDIKLNLKDMAQSATESVKEAVKDKVNQEVGKAKTEAIQKAQEQADKLMKEADVKANQLIAAAKTAASQINETAKNTATQIRNESNTKASQIEKEGNNPIAKKLAKESADKIRKEGDKKASDVEAKAQQESQAKVNQTQAEADKIRANAKAQGDKLIEEAKKK